MKGLNVRLDDDLHQKLVERAKRDRRSLNSELACLLERAIEIADKEDRARVRSLESIPA